MVGVVYEINNLIGFVSVNFSMLKMWVCSLFDVVVVYEVVLL